MVLVSGAAGLCGSMIVEECARRGLPVRALVRSRERARAKELALLPDIEWVEGDMARPETLAHALDGVHRALMISSAGERMLETQLAFVDACRRARVGHVVKLSGQESGVGFRPERFRSTRMHEEIERHLERSGLAYTHLRPSQFMQVYLREARTIADHGALLLPMGESKLAPVDVLDIARVAAALLGDGEHEGQSFVMTGPEALTMAEIADRIGSAIGRPVRYFDVTPEERRRLHLATGMPEERADALDELFAERRRCRASAVSLATHAAFGIPPTSFEQFARRCAAALRGE